MAEGVAMLISREDMERVVTALKKEIEQSGGKVLVEFKEVVPFWDFVTLCDGLAVDERVVSKQYFIFGKIRPFTPFKDKDDFRCLNIVIEWGFVIQLEQRLDTKAEPVHIKVFYAF